MNLTDKVTPEEARLLYTAPLAAATYVSLASGGVADFVKEMAGAGRFVVEQTQPGMYGELVDTLVSTYSAGGRARAHEIEQYYRSRDQAAIRVEARQAVVQAAAVLRRLAENPGPDERAGDQPDDRADEQSVRGDEGDARYVKGCIEGYRNWLMAAARTAALTDVGTFSGGAGRREIDLHEQAAIEELAGILLGLKR
jgi:hypothetical protein